MLMDPFLIAYCFAAFNNNFVPYPCFLRSSSTPQNIYVNIFSLNVMIPSVTTALSGSVSV